MHVNEPAAAGSFACCRRVCATVQREDISFLWEKTTKHWGQEAGDTGDWKQGVLGTGSRGYWGLEAGGPGDRKQGVLGTGSRGTGDRKQGVLGTESRGY